MRHVVFAGLAGTLAVLIAVAIRPTAPPATAQSPVPLAEFDAACASDNPYFVTSSFAMGMRTNEPALVAFRDTPDDSHVVLARYDQIGATYGLAYDSRHRQVYVAAYHKRGTPYGPGGPGTIYRMDLATGAIAPWVDVPDAGTNLHDDTQNYIPDRPARDYAGKTSLGDIDLDEAGETLFVVNMQSRKILRYRLADASLIATFDHGAAYQTWAGAEARPFGLKVWQGKLYHAVIRDASRSRRSADLIAYVYESDLDGKNMRAVLSFKLDYFRGYIPPRIEANWLPWRDGTDSIAPNGTHDHAYIYPMPMLADLEFSDAGDMILGFRDRIGDMSLYDRNRNLPRGELSGHPFGDIVLARREGTSWSAEPWPEFFNEDAGPGMNATGGFHIDTGFGGLARLTQSHTVINTAVSPWTIHSGGAIWFDLDTGGDRRRETLYVGNAGRTNFGKANGLGDLELLCGETLATATPTVTDTATPSSTPTATSPATATPTASATPIATSTPTITPTPTPAVIYLPMAEKSKLCLSDAYRTDVVLVLDRSTSMLRSIEPGGIAKNEAAIAAAKAFIDFLDFTPDDKNRFDQVAVVGFNDNAWIELGLTNDRMAALDALERIRTKTIEGTRLDLAFEWGQKPLDTPERKPENRPVLIMLTDGLPNRVPFGAGTRYPESRRQEDTVLKAVDAVKAKGTRVYTIGLGTPRDILPWLLIASASDRDMYYYAPVPEDLAGIYERIAQTFNECNPKPPPKRCVPEELHADVVLVLDMSTSMYRETRGGRTKHEAAIAAAHQFVADLDLDRDGWGRQDQVAVVGFNGSVWTAIGLGDDRAAIDAAIDGLPGRIAEGTRIDLGLAQGQGVYEIGERLQPNVPVVILLTDGLPNQVPFGPGSPYPQCDRQECSVLAVADGVKAKGTRVYAIGLGESSDVLRTLLEGVASDPGMYYFAPDGEDLAAIYRQIAGRLQTCEP